MQDCRNSSALAKKLQQSCTKPLIYLLTLCDLWHFKNMCELSDSYLRVLMISTLRKNQCTGKLCTFWGISMVPFEITHKYLTMHWKMGIPFSIENLRALRFKNIVSMFMMFEIVPRHARCHIHVCISELDHHGFGYWVQADSFIDSLWPSDTNDLGQLWLR